MEMPQSDYIFSRLSSFELISLKIRWKSPPKNLRRKNAALWPKSRKSEQADTAQDIAKFSSGTMERAMIQGSSSSAPCVRVIVVGNEKGGSGKSTVAMHIAVALLKSARASPPSTSTPAAQFHALHRQPAGLGAPARQGSAGAEPRLFRRGGRILHRR